VARCLACNSGADVASTNLSGPQTKPVRAVCASGEAGLDHSSNALSSGAAIAADPTTTSARRDDNPSLVTTASSPTSPRRSGTSLFPERPLGIQPLGQESETILDPAILGRRASNDAILAAYFALAPPHADGADCRRSPVGQ
jgi:hypothetical protein